YRGPAKVPTPSPSGRRLPGRRPPVIRRSGRSARGPAYSDAMDRRSSELLGFAPDARVLIVNCDDFGMHDAINAAVVDSIENGIASSASLMVTCPEIGRAHV